MAYTDDNGGWGNDPGYLNYYDPYSSPDYQWVDQTAQANGQVTGQQKAPNGDPNLGDTGGSQPPVSHTMAGPSANPEDPSSPWYQNPGWTPPEGYTGDTPTVPQPAAGGGAQAGAAQGGQGPAVDPAFYPQGAGASTPNVFGRTPLEQNLYDNQIGNLYQSYWGRLPSEQERQAAMGNPGGVGAYVNYFSDWKRTHPDGPMVTPTGNPPPGQPINPTSPGSSWTPSPYGGAGSSGVPQFQAPDFSKLFGQQQDALSHILTTPVMSPDYVARLGEQQKELALGRGRSAAHAADINAAGRGVAGGGAASAMKQRLAGQLTQQLLQSQRDVSNTAETTNRQGLESAIGATSSATANQGGVANSFYNSLLSGNQEAFNQWLATQKLSQGQSQFDTNTQFNYAKSNQDAYDQFIANILGR